VSKIALVESVSVVILYILVIPN